MRTGSCTQAHTVLKTLAATVCVSTALLTTGCEPSGACCSDAQCEVTTQDACGGDFRIGAGCTPNPCVGACCGEDGVCAPDQTNEQCSDVGRFLGDGTTCEPNPCVGACCDLDGVCLVVNEPDCDGEFAGRATNCEPNPCLGACCDENGVCSLTTQENCSGTYGGDATVCDAAACTGACCVGSGCTLQTRPDCDAVAGAHQGIGTLCQPNPCGACCSGSSCELKSEAECAGEFHAGGLCNPNICAGACCRTDGTCQDNALEADCNAEQGQYLGAGTACDAGSCRGACCTNGECVLVTDEECGSIDGMFQGAATSCIPDVCTQLVTGACCVAETASCAVVSMTICGDLSGVFLGDGSSCSQGCPCEFADDCPTANDLCAITLCESGKCLANPKCTSGEMCDESSGACIPTNEPAVCCFGTFCEDNFSGELSCTVDGGTHISGATCAQVPNPCLP